MWPFSRSNAAIEADVREVNNRLIETGEIAKRFHSGQMSEHEKQAAIQRLRLLRSGL